MNAVSPLPKRSDADASQSNPALSAELCARFQALERIRLAEMAALFRRGVSALTLCTPEFPARARVAWVEGESWFDLADEIEDDRPHEAALIFLARDEAGDPVDLITWSPTSDRVASWFWHAPVLGLETLWWPRIADEGALPVYKSAWTWLRNGRDGLLLVNLPRAIPVLREAGKLVVESVDLGIKIQRHVRAGNPKIVVRKEALVND